jgi:hypothetical protein
MGVQVQGGRLAFLPGMVSQAEFLGAPKTFVHVDLEGRDCTLELGEGTLAFTLCQVPVVVHRAGPPRLVVTVADGACRSFEDLELDEATSEAVFQRTGSVARVDVHLGL